MRYDFTKDQISNMKPSDNPEWVMTLGNGGYSSGSVLNSAFRHHHGYLIASKKPPIERYLTLVRTEERIQIGADAYNTTSQVCKDKTYNGHQYLERFVFSGVPTYTYVIKDIVIDKTISPLYGSNTVVIHYDIINGRNASKIAISPLMNVRSHGDTTLPSDSEYSVNISDDVITLFLKKDPLFQIKMRYSTGVFDHRFSNTIKEIIHTFDQSTGDERFDSYHIPFEFKLELTPHEHRTFDLIVTTDELPQMDAISIIESYLSRQNELVDHAGYEDVFTKKLVIAADQFIAYRQSTHSQTILAGLPWFTDWGRDTMIAFGGLCLSTKRFEEAKSILKSFALYEKNGLIPNMFPDDGQEPLYNTVDASLWYFQAIHQYFLATNDQAFIINELYPVLKEIVNAYEHGTNFSIKMDQDGLIHAGSGLDQVTWMDVRINGIVVTPRHGKPVEINALWYNALCIMSDYGHLAQDDTSHYEELAALVKTSFLKRFVCQKTSCLLDVVDFDDDSIRPNQVYSAALAYPIIDQTLAKKVLKVVEEELLDIYGLRTLSIHDPRFKPVYEGPIEKRDFAYHMGTVWPFLLGGYLDSYLYAYDYSIEALIYARDICHRFTNHMQEYCINGIAEIFDGHHGTISRGCYTQAWSVGEILRIYTKYKLYDLPKKG